MKNQLLFSIFACSLASIGLFCQVAVSQTESDAYDVRVISDLSYVEEESADADKHKLDIYLPEGLAEFPTVLWIHGGAWVVGGRKQEEQLARRFAERGIGLMAMSWVFSVIWTGFNLVLRRHILARLKRPCW